MLDIFKNLFSATSRDIATLFKKLRKENPETASLVESYVAGNDPTALMRLGPTAPRDIDDTYRWYWDREGIEKIVANPGRLTFEQWVRLGEVYALAPSLAKASPAAAPPWFYALQNFRQQYSETPAVWELGFLQGVLHAGGISPQENPRIITTAFLWNLHTESGRNPMYAWENATNTEQAQHFVAYLHANIAEVPPALQKAPAAKRVAAAKWLEFFPDLIEPLTPMLIEWVTSSSKTVREAALTLLQTLPESQRWNGLATAIDQGAPANLATVIDYAGRSDAAGRAVLEAALSKGRGGKIDDMLTTALQRSQVVSQTPAVDITIPPAPPLDDTPLGEDFITALDAEVKKMVAELEKAAAAESAYQWQKENLAAAKKIDSYEIRSWLNGERKRPDGIKQLSLNAWSRLNLPFVAAVRASCSEGRYKKEREIHLNKYWLGEIFGHDYDLRNLATAATMAGVEDPVATVSNFGFGWGEQFSQHRPEDVWPFFAENPLRLDQELGLAPKPKRENDWFTGWLPQAIQILEMFPVLPPKYVPALAQFATSEAKTNRLEAQKILEKQPNALAIAAQGLDSGKGEIRATTAAWIGRIGDADGIELLQKALAKEKRELPQAAMLNALKLLGDDISAHLEPAVLDAAATKGLAAKIPASLSWFPLDALPPCKWKDGTPVTADTIRWWAVLAAKLKDPNGAGLIPIYVSLLAEDSAQQLGSFVLEAWTTQDTKGPSDEECRAYATSQVDSRYKDYQSWMKRYSEEYYAAKAAMTKDQVFDELRTEKSREYLGSAINEKGLLALTSGAPGHLVLSTAQRYIRDHGQRRSQVEALIIAAAANDDPSAISLVLSVARKYKQETVRNKAAELAESIAERRGWTIDELADRTIPTAGFDEAGILSLEYGSRSFTGRVSRSAKTNAFTIDVFNIQGKTIASLPKPGVNDDEALANDSRKQLTTSKKELGQVVALQSARLFEAMCLGRTWDAPSWQEYLHAHPIMRHLISTLIWKAWETTVDGPYQLFRPSAEGEILNAEDESITLAPQQLVSLAHLATVTSAEAQIWRTNLADYEIEPLFSQFESVTPPTSTNTHKIEDHLGWLSDSFAIRTRATKRGYSRGYAEDGGWFRDYTKNLPSAEITVIIEFTGSFLPEEQIAAAVERLGFTHKGREMPLSEVPPILLAESYADYAYIAEAGTFDPQWESKSAY
ncbi:MAG: DUF4132 domain-containing protein [Propionibacteriaceae bacterium]|nr:DUF4132 domain-containing protein [Propionibacteriaceae bacterium]